MLRMIAGSETPTSGTIRIDAQNRASVPTNCRRIGSLFQNDGFVGSYG